MATTAVEPAVDEKLTYRYYKDADRETVEYIFKQHDVDPPDPSISIMAICENEAGQIVALLPLQLVAHSEPLWMARKYQGKVSWKRLLAMVEAHIRGVVKEYYVFAPDSRIAKMAETVGMDKLPWSIFRRRL